MNYEKIYNNLCELCNSTTPKERLLARNKNKHDERLNMLEGVIYTERHHILPRHSGGNDDPENLVTMLPEEHLLAHMLLYKVYKKREDFLAVRLIVNGFIGKGERVLGYDVYNNKSFLSCYALYRQSIYRFRTEVGWHSDDGRKRISESRINKMLCVDAKTNEQIGMVDCDHPNILNGKWVSFYKDKVMVVDKFTLHKTLIGKDELDERKHVTHSSHIGANIGDKNPNFKLMTEKRREKLMSIVPHAVNSEGVIVRKEFIRLLKLKFADEFKKISMVWVDNNFGSFHEFIDTYNHEYNANIIKSNNAYKSVEHRNKLRNANIGKKRKKNKYD